MQNFKDIDVLIGSAATAIGSSSAIIHMMNKIGGLILVGLNILLTIMGIVLVAHRIRIAKKKGDDIKL